MTTSAMAFGHGGGHFGGFVRGGGFGGFHGDGFGNGHFGSMGMRGPPVRAAGSIRMALAKSFVFNARRANRICTHNKAALALDRLDRTRFLKATEPLIDVRDVNEHGFDGGATKPRIHHNEGGLIDETSMMITGPEKILMGPLNLYDVYLAVDRVRKLAGFVALAEKKMKEGRPENHPSRGL